MKVEFEFNLDDFSIDEIQKNFGLLKVMKVMIFF